MVAVQLLMPLPRTNVCIRKRFISSNILALGHVKVQKCLGGCYCSLKRRKRGSNSGEGTVKKTGRKVGNKLRKNGDYGGLMPSGEAAEWRRFRRAENSFFHPSEPVGQAE